MIIVGTDVDIAVWGPPAPSVVALERDLARLRRARAGHASEDAHTVARAAVLNLVVLATREAHALRAGRAIERLSLRHPSRAIVVLSDRRERDVPPSIAMYAQLPTVERSAQVCYEQILLRAHGRAEDRLASAVIPLLIPDLPVFVWWTETPPVGAHHFEDLLALADRFIVDSADFARPERTLPALARVCVIGRSLHGLTDLNWARLTPWRETLTQFFDVPAWRPYLGGIGGLRVGFAVDADGRQIHPSQALLVVGWLGSRLGWRAADPMAPSEAGGHLFAMRRPDGGIVHVRIRPRFERGLTEGDLSGIVVEAAAGSHRAEFRIRRNDDRRHAAASVRIDDAPVAQRVVPLPSPDVGELLGEELTIVGVDAVYEDALALLVTLS